MKKIYYLIVFCMLIIINTDNIIVAQNCGNQSLTGNGFSYLPATANVNSIIVIKPYFTAKTTPPDASCGFVYDGITSVSANNLDYAKFVNIWKDSDPTTNPTWNHTVWEGDNNIQAMELWQRWSGYFGYFYYVNSSKVIKGNNYFNKNIPDYCKGSGMIDLRQFLIEPISRGTFSSTGCTIEGNYLNTNTSNPGTYTISYNSPGGMVSTRTVKIKGVEWTTTDIGIVCEAEDEIDIDPYVSVVGATYSGVGVTGNVFSPRIAGSGIKTINVTYIDVEGCNWQKSINVNVKNGGNTEWLSDISACKNTGLVQLKTYVKTNDLSYLTDVTFSGSYVSSGNFNTGTAPAGVYTVKMVYDGECRFEDYAKFDVIESPTITVYDVEEQCYSNQIIDLNKYVDKTGGFFEGIGVFDHYVNTDNLVIGKNDISYTYGQAGCNTTKVFEIEVKDRLINPNSITFQDLPSMCKNGNSVDLRQYVNTQEGYFIGSGVNTLNDILYPSSAPEGRITVTFMIDGEGSCEVAIPKKFWNYNTVDYNFLDLPIVCENKNIEIRNYINPITEVYGVQLNGNGVNNGTIFNSELAGIGVHNINGNIIDKNGCIYQYNKDIIVSDLNPEFVYFISLPNVCKNGAPINLLNYVSYPNGVFTGEGVVGTYFDPNATTAGIKEITYTYGSGYCKKELIQYIEVLPIVNIVIATVPEICFAGTIINLEDYTNVDGGTFSGNGVTGKQFYANTAGIGTHEIVYTYQDGLGCQVSKSFTIKVNSLLKKDIVWSSIPEMCKDANNIDLKNYINEIEGEGTFTGDGVVGSYFSPAQAKVGANLVKYVQGIGVCVKEYEKIINVNAIPVITNIDIPNVCFKQDIINLASYVTPTGGAFVSPYVVGTEFRANLVTAIGTYDVIYRYTNAGNCIAEKILKVKVSGLYNNNPTWNVIPELCNNGDPINLSSYLVDTQPMKGVFSGVGVVGTYFNPSQALIGLNEIKYIQQTSDGCYKETVTYIKVNSTVNVEVLTIPSLCYSGDSLILKNYVIPNTGVFTGTGVSNGKFYASVAGKGTHQVTYSITSANGCTLQKPITIIVNDLLKKDVQWSTIPELCSTSSSINLFNYINDVSGTFTGNGIVGNYFSPAAAVVGANQITYTQGTGICQKTFTTIIIVNNVEEITVNTIPEICYAGDSIDLINYITPFGGVFTGKGISGTVFKGDVAGIGTHSILYVYSNGLGCSKEKVFNIKVNSLLKKDVQWSTIPEMCQNDPGINLLNYINDQNGVFVGAGITGSYFNPASALVGMNKIDYIQGAGACSRTISTYIKVNAVPVITVNTLPTICFAGDSIVLENYVQPAGGTYTGKGISGTVFKADIAGVGTHQIKYRVVSSSGCIAEKTFDIVVNSLLKKDVQWAVVPEFCRYDASINLFSYINDNSGVFAGDGVVGNMFVPSTAKSGVNQVKYVQGTGVCQREYLKTIIVNEIPVITVNTLPTICFAGDSIVLENYVQPAGGTYTGKGISGTVFKADIAGVGTHQIKYRVVSSSGCIAEKTFNIIVNSLLQKDVQWIKVPDVCQNGDNIDLYEYINDNTGQFEGPGVSGNYFDPTKANIGVNAIYYVQGIGVCQRKIVNYIKVIAVPNIQIQTLPALCYVGDSIILKNYVNPLGGVFEGAGVVNGVFKSDVAGIGIHEIKYKVGTMCQSEKMFTIVVNDQLDKNVQWDVIPNMCKNDAEINLYDYINDNTGLFNGSAVSINYFVPSKAQIGNNLVTYIQGSGVCQKTYNKIIKVNDIPTISILQIPEICYAGQTIDLINYVNPKGGTFTGQGVSNGIFVADIAGIGNHEIIYRVYNENGCYNEKTIVVKVNNLGNSNISWQSISPICQGGDPIELFDYVNDNTGVFSGVGVVGNTFNPMNLQAGNYEITYTQGTGVCQRSIKTTIRVISAPAITFKDLGFVCSSDSVNLIDYVNVSGGIFNGNGVENNLFYPLKAGKGVHEIEYTVSNASGCSGFAYSNINVVIDKELLFYVDRSVVNSSAMVKFGMNETGNVTWYFGDGGYSLEAKPYHYYYHQGEMNVRVKIEKEGCIIDKTENSMVVVGNSLKGEHTVNIKNAENIIAGYHDFDKETEDMDSKLSVYPIPFNDILKIDGVINHTIIVYDLSGKIRYRKDNCMMNEEVNTSEWENGVYFMKVIGEKNKSIKLIKSK